MPQCVNLTTTAPTRRVWPRLSWPLVLVAWHRWAPPALRLLS